MFLKPRQHHRFARQRGFLLPLALFIVVVMGVLGLTISRTASQNQTAVVQEFLNLQSFYAAESGAQRGMQALFLNTGGRLAADTACLAMNINTNFASVAGLRACSAAVTCSCRYQSGAACAPAVATNYEATAAADLLISFYTVTSVGTCGQEKFRAQRSIQAGAFMEQAP